MGQTLSEPFALCTGGRKPPPDANVVKKDVDIKKKSESDVETAETDENKGEEYGNRDHLDGEYDEEYEEEYAEDHQEEEEEGMEGEEVEEAKDTTGDWEPLVDDALAGYDEYSSVRDQAALKETTEKLKEAYESTGRVRLELTQEEKLRIKQENEERVQSLIRGDELYKYNYRDHKRQLVRMWVSDDLTELCWLKAGKYKPNKPRVKCSRVSLSSALGVSFGQVTTCFSRAAAKDPTWLSMSLFFHDRTLDISCQNDSQIIRWFLGLQYLVAKKGQFIVTKGLFLWTKARLRLQALSQQSKSTPAQVLLDIVKICVLQKSNADGEDDVGNGIALIED
eukprot:GILI01006470.1.p1 GENE.GILI01006470.1~~GILI01006470.1.p1  ORF type:complete len:337 (-),score=89.35 GILI01006470.1:247-1257(-)